MKNYFLSFVLVAVGFAGCKKEDQQTQNPLIDPREVHLTDIQQLTFAGQNAEAYLSGDDKQLIFQSENDSTPCDQIFIMNIDGSNIHRVSNGLGKTTCSYFIPGTNKIIYSSTFAGDSACPPPADFSKGYVWPIYESHDIYISNADGSDLKKLTDVVGYDAEATVSVDGSKIVFTSMRNGDLDIYTMNSDGSNVKQVTNEIGYDGGAFFSHDGKKIVYRASHPKDEEEKANYLDLLNQGIVRPTTFQLYVMDADGSNKKQLTDNDGANFAPYFTPDDKKIIFATNIADTTSKRIFDLWLINADGTGEMERVTYNSNFNGFPMFTKDGKKLVFASNRTLTPDKEKNVRNRSTNIFVAEWKD